ncbi:hypothetical protein QFZ65_001487 [Arthrobacter sp. B3I9]|uniref:hypothetical protein n=1 Tax=Arthrobacter sp. B3I9 TaxID=3042270 RepID=UPI002791CD11|nr:hypothetical protein [Arthrobacter sp. B3I9]MDQ0849549.1 hypothetical protein [Arthrobacter sp. B3I9]
MVSGTASFEGNNEFQTNEGSATRCRTHFGCVPDSPLGGTGIGGTPAAGRGKPNLADHPRVPDAVARSNGPDDIAFGASCGDPPKAVAYTRAQRAGGRASSADAPRH